MGLDYDDGFEGTQQLRPRLKLAQGTLHWLAVYRSSARVSTESQEKHHASVWQSVLPAALSWREELFTCLQRVDPACQESLKESGRDQHASVWQGVLPAAEAAL